MELVGGSTAKASEMLGVSIRKIQYRLKEYSGEIPPHTGDQEPEA